MSRSDSKIDLGKYKPSPEDVRRIADEEAAQERLRKALDNPALDAAIAELADRAPQPPRTSTPSPWAEPGSEAVDRDALPSAGGPAAPPVTAPIKGRRPRAQRWSPGNKALAAITLAFLPAMIVFILFVKPPQEGAQQAVPSSTGAAPTAAASAAPTASASTTASAEPAATATNSAAATSSAPTVARQPLPAAPGQPRPRRAIDDPYNGAPAVTVSPTATAAPSAAAAATTAQPSPPPPATATSAGSPFLRRRPE